LYLHPSQRRPALVQTRLVLRDVALTVSRNHLRPRLETIPSEPSHRKHEIGVSDDIFQSRATFAQWASGRFTPVAIKHVERDEHRRRGDGVWVGLAQPVGARTGLLVENRHLDVEDDRASGQLSERRDVEESSGMGATAATVMS